MSRQTTANEVALKLHDAGKGASGDFTRAYSLVDVGELVTGSPEEEL